jgi:hypothetical protein
LKQATQDVSEHLILLGDLNCNLAAPAPKDEHACDISSDISILNLTDIANHYTHPHGKWTWSQRRSGRYIRSTTDYILVQDHQIFSRWTIKIPRYNSDH